MIGELDDHYPTVDLIFMCELIEGSHKVIDRIKVGDTTAYILSGKRPVGERTITVRDVGDNSVDYIFATGNAIKLGLMGPLLKWLEENKHWKDGGYF
ncbi:hypothetical protein [Spirosoma spitsbergense]|uniref:hypothetical protein n=1 Tax=Spirosoma spitsbergense TaxID=431554 RepID=UPI00036418DE|nr:hypothetical protein [Spirosoma spitsbergense]